MKQQRPLWLFMDTRNPLTSPESDPGADQPLIRRDWLIAFGVALLAGLICVALGDHRGFWLDEYYTLRAAQMNWADLVRDRFGAGHSPVYFFYARWPLLFGTGERVLRLSSAVMVSASVLLVTGLAGTLSLRRYLPAIWVLCVILPYWLTAGTEYRYMMPVIALAAAVAWAAAAYSRDWSRPLGLLLAILLTLILWVHGSAQFVALGILLFLLWEARVRAGRWAVTMFARPWPVALGLLGSSPLLFLVEGGKKGKTKLPSFGSFIKDSCEAIFGNEDTWSSVFHFPSAIILISEVAILGFAVYLAWRELHARSKDFAFRLLACLFFGIIISPPLTTFFIRNIQGPARYLAGASVPALLLLAVAWNAQMSVARRRLFRGAMGLVLIVQACGAALTHGDMHREAIQFVMANDRGSEKVLVSSALVNMFAFEYLGFAHPAKVVKLTEFPGERKNEDVENRFESTFERDTKGFVLLYHDDRKIDELMDTLKESGFLRSYRMWVFARNTIVIAFVRTPQDEAWLKSLPAPKIPAGPRMFSWSDQRRTARNSR